MRKRKLLIRALVKRQPRRKMSCSLDFLAVAFVTRESLVQKNTESEASLNKGAKSAPPLEATSSITRGPPSACNSNKKCQASAANRRSPGVPPGVR